MFDESKRNTYPDVYMEQEIMCPVCGARISADNMYCPYCGSRLRNASVDDVVLIPPDDPDDPSMRTVYDSPNVMNDVYASPDAMTILYASPEPMDDTEYAFDQDDRSEMAIVYASPSPGGVILSGLASLFRKK